MYEGRLNSFNTRVAVVRYGKRVCVKLHFEIGNKHLRWSNVFVRFNEFIKRPRITRRWTDPVSRIPTLTTTKNIAKFAIQRAPIVDLQPRKLPINRVQVFARYDPFYERFERASIGHEIVAARVGESKLEGPQELLKRGKMRQNSACFPIENYPREKRFDSVEHVQAINLRRKKSRNTGSKYLRNFVILNSWFVSGINTQ